MKYKILTNGDKFIAKIKRNFFFWSYVVDGYCALLFSSSLIPPPAKKFNSYEDAEMACLSLLKKPIKWVDCTMRD